MAEIWDELGETRYRLDVLEHDVTDTSPLIDRIKAIDAELNRVMGIKSVFLNPYTPIIQRLQQQFDIQELTAVAYDAGIKMEHVGGDRLPDICLRLVEYAVRRNRLLELMTKAGEARPPVEEWLEML